MAKTAIISVDGHVRASRSDYRNYVEQSYLDAFDDWARAEEAAGAPESGNLSAGLDPTSQWDSDLRLKDMESQGVVAEVLFPNGLPFQARPADDVGAFSGPRARPSGPLGVQPLAGRLLRPGAGSEGGSGADLVRRYRRGRPGHPWAREHGLGGVMMPALLPGGVFFFDPVLDPVWAACVEVGLPISQHGGSGAPTYGPPGFAAIMTLALEHSFYSGRSLWQMILGGVFERFPALRVAFVETEADWIAPTIRKLDRRLQWGDDWTGWAQTLQRMRQFSGSAREYWAANCFAGISPFTEDQVPLDELAPPECRVRALRHRLRQHDVRGRLPPLRVRVPRHRTASVNALVQHPSITAEVARKILCENAADLYGFDLKGLAGDIERVGFEVDGQERLDRR